MAKSRVTHIRPAAQPTPYPPTALVHADKVHDLYARLSEIAHALRGIEEGLTAATSSAYVEAQPSALLDLLRDRLCDELDRLDEAADAGLKLALGSRGVAPEAAR